MDAVVEREKAEIRVPILTTRVASRAEKLMMEWHEQPRYMVNVQNARERLKLMKNERDCIMITSTQFRAQYGKATAKFMALSAMV